LIDDLQLEVIDHRNLSVTAFETSAAPPDRRRIVRFNMRGNGTNASTSLTAFESTHSFSHHPPVPLDIKIMAQARKLRLADPPDDSGNLPIEILIGGDYYWKIVKDAAPIRLSPSVVLLPSKLGWILSGNRSAIMARSIMVNYVELGQSTFTSDDDVRRFWDLETLGITDKQDKFMSARDTALLREFHASYALEDQRRVVSLPRKGNITLPSNHHNAERLFHRLEQRLEGNAALRQVYHAHMLDYIKKEQVEIAPPAEGTAEEFYLPHHAVKKEKRGETKWRIVFDGSSHENHSPSLNDALEMGPNLLPEILATLLRFRLYPVGIIGDIGQAFLQLSLHKGDRDLTRFFWYRVIKDEDGTYDTTREIITYRFTRLPFGLTCSPFLLSATIRELADMYAAEFPTAAALVDNSTFMDDFAAGSKDDDCVTNLYYELSHLMSQIRLPMAKWATNSRRLKEVWRTEGVDFKEVTQTLGIDWDTKTDTFLMDPRDVIGESVEGPTTKRQLLQTTAKFYDPLGLLSPVSVVGKLLFQDTWCRGLSWDEILPCDLGAPWNAWVSTLQHLKYLRVPRWVGIVDTSHCQIHVFCDASERAYGAAVYIRSCMVEHDVVRLACSKNRLAPVKRVTLPRLELLAALVGARLLHYFCQATSLDIAAATLWTDSTVALGWIRQDPNRWKTFVCNRVTEIQSYTTPSQWRHCPGRDNPADLLSRGVNAEQLKNLDLWWHGPPWLADPPQLWPPNTPPVDVLPEVKGPTNHTLSVEVPRRLLDPTRYSSYWKLLRVTAWVLRFWENALRRDRRSGNLTASELEAARSYWVQAAQGESFAAELKALQENLPLPERSKIARFNPFLDEGLIRLGGRLQFATLPREQRHPLLLDGQHHFTRLLILQTHIRLHHLGVRIILAELREEFWILRARQAIKRVLYSCLPCRIAKGLPGGEIEAPLPADRVTPLRPFAVTGIDYAGPLFVKVGHTLKKGYIALFTCATTRAVHLELCLDLSTDKFLLALQRFTGRRGLPNTVYTDNAQTFHAANRELKELCTALSAARTHQYFAERGIRWRFITPRAAWWGGWWERMVATTKRCLRKVLGRSQVDTEGLQTILVEIEAAIHSRPITQDHENETLTPAHFLTGGRLTTIPHCQNRKPY
jgi:hypothetical protein